MLNMRWCFLNNRRFVLTLCGLRNVGFNMRRRRFGKRNFVIVKHVVKIEQQIIFGQVNRQILFGVFFDNGRRRKFMADGGYAGQ